MKKTKMIKITSGILTGVLTFTAVVPNENIFAEKITSAQVLPYNQDVSIKIEDRGNDIFYVKILAKRDIFNAQLRLNIDNKETIIYNYEKLEEGKLVEEVVNLKELLEKKKALPNTSIVKKEERFSTEISGKKIRGVLTYEIHEVTGGGSVTPIKPTPKPTPVNPSNPSNPTNPTNPTTPKTSKQGEVTEFSSVMSGRQLKSTGSSVPVVVKGTNLTKDELALEVSSEGTVISNIEIDIQNETSTEITYLVSLPKNESETVKNYTVKLKQLDEQVLTPLEFSVKASEKTNSDNTASITLNSVKLGKGGNSIVAEFSENIFNAKTSIEELKKAITIVENTRANARYPKYVKLTDQDFVVINDNKISIMFATPLNTSEDLVNYKFDLKDGAIKNADNKLNEQISFMFFKEEKAAKPEITNYEIKNYTLASSGGVIEIDITGTNLVHSEKDTRIKLVDVENNTEAVDITSAVAYEKVGDKLVAKVTLPENTTTTTKSYAITFYSNGQKVFTKTGSKDDKEVLSVLPAGKNNDDITISNITINSYAASTSGDASKKLNLKHTVVATNQESKKTFVRVYGTNLKENLTKVRVFDENGVEWPIFSAGSSLKGTYPLMILPGKSGKGNGIVGEGNFQLLEVILPNNLDSDMTFTYYISVDGSGELLESNKVTAHVQAILKGLATDKKELTVNYENESGEKIKDSKKLTGYSWFEYNFADETVEGYKLKNAKNNEELTGTFGDTNKEITLVYTKSDNSTENPKNDNELATSEDKDKLKAVAVAPSKIEDYTLADDSLKVEYSDIRKSALELVNNDKATKKEVADKLKEVEAVKTRLLENIASKKNSNGNTNPVDNNGELATQEDKERLTNLAVKLSEIPDYELASNELKEAYTTIRKEAIKLLAGDITKKDLEEQITKVKKVKDDLLADIESKKNSNGNTNPVDNNGELATEDDKAELLQSIPVLSKIENYQSASEDLKLEYTTVRTKVREAIKGDLTKAELEKLKKEIADVKQRFLDSIK